MFDRLHGDELEWSFLVAPILDDMIAPAAAGLRAAEIVARRSSRSISPMRRNISGMNSGSSRIAVPT
jgi:hypothetical protein